MGKDRGNPGSDGRRSRQPIRVPQRFVVRSCYPQAMQEDRELAGDCGGGALLRGLAAASSEVQPVAPQVTVGAERTQQPLRTLQQEASQPGVACLADVQLRIAVTGRATAWAQADPGTDSS